ncbi:MmgE/PrpD family protein [Acidovorax delafieldii 2AN]|uniref:MmgE/PrpD family protein n=1 Tax=Acidovorax delafieldii 2AN TaxID=573060 RepID=C5T5H2_ACIDE|nr:MmgE/PrpD family protein [Acidovorax delafieldii]EER60282.1 MmgE/PrpD family protein [Acidovorax delafieldii 2AN]
MTDESSGLEVAVAQFVVGFGSSDIDAVARASALSLIKDQLAIQVGASRLPWSRQVRAARQLRPGKSTIVGERETVAAADAAYINATYGHGFEYDDYAGNAHPGCCVVPVALAVGEELGASLEQMLVAMVAGYEAYVRIGRLGSPDLLNAGWQPHSVLANFGAAAVAAKLHGLDAERTLHALSIALSHASGTTEYASTGGSIKRAHAGMAARNGVEAVDLARAGITGPRRFLTGDRGLYRTFIRKVVTDEARGDFLPGQPLQISQLSFKAYCCCAANHAYIEGMAGVRSRAGSIESVEARIQTMSDAIVGTRNAHIYQPRNIEELQYSLPTQMALSALGLGNGYRVHRDFLEGRLQLTPESEALQFARRIKLTVSRELDEKYPRKFVADMTVRYADGSSEDIFVDRVTGRPDKPYTPQEHQAKLDELTLEILGRERANQLFQLVDSFPSPRPVGELTALLRVSE